MKVANFFGASLGSIFGRGSNEEQGRDESARELNDRDREIALRMQLRMAAHSRPREPGEPAQRILNLSNVIGSQAAAAAAAAGAVGASFLRLPGDAEIARSYVRPGPFTTWIRGLKSEVEIYRFQYMIFNKKNAPDRLEFRREVGILNWMEVVKDYSENPS